MESLSGRPALDDSRVIRIRILLVLSLTVLVCTWIGWGGGRTDDIGSLPRVRLQARLSVDPLQRGDVTHRVYPVHSGRLMDQIPTPPVTGPLLVRIPAIGVNARVVPVGVDVRTGGVQIPQDVRTVGWYRFGASPGSDGTAVLVGHVDSREQGAGAFFRLQELKPGASVMVHLVDGSIARFEVVARRFYPKDQLPKDTFGPSHTPTLSLVTCGGPFDRSTGHYADNVVVYAVLEQ